MEYFPTKMFLFLLLLAGAKPACGVEVTDTVLGVTDARLISYDSEAESVDELVGTYIEVIDTEELQDIPFLLHQLGINVPPRRWILFDIQGRIPDDQARLITRDDNMYISGFANKSGHIHAFKGHEDALPGATVVSQGDTYREFTNTGPIDALTSLVLSKEFFQDDAHALANFPNVLESDWNLAVARMIVMIPEAARIKPIRSRIKEIWESGGQGSLEDIEANYCMNWGTMSLSVLCGNRGIRLTGNDASALREIKVSTMEDVKRILAVGIQNRRFDPNNPRESCRRRNNRKRKRGRMSRDEKQEEERPGMKRRAGREGSGSQPH